MTIVGMDDMAGVPLSVSEVLSWATEQDYDEAVDDPGFVHDELGDNAGTTTAGDGYDIGSLTGGLLAYYPFDGDVNDDTELSNDGTNNGGTFNGSGQVGSDSINFNGTDEYVSLPDFGLGDDTAFTIAFYMNSDVTDTATTLFGRYDGTDDLLQLREQDDSNNFRVRIGHDGGNELDYTGTQPSGSSWEHVAVVYRPGSESEYWLNGALDASSSGTVDDFATSNGPYVAGRNDSGSLVDPYGGDIDDFRIYGRALSPQEITGLSNRTATSPVTAGDTV